MIGFRLSQSWLLCLTLFMLLTAVVVSPVTAQAQVTGKQRQQIRKIQSSIDRAGRLFQNKKYDESAKLVKQIQSDLESLTVNASKALIDLVDPQYRRLTTAHRLLIEAGQTLPALKSLPPGKTEDGETAVSFVRDVAGILNSKCGNCHVRRERGQFSLANYRALMNGLGGSPVVVPDKPEESYIIEVIESGEMPQGGLTVSEDELNKLKAWISQGAKFDGTAPQANIAAIARSNNRAPRPASLNRPTGNETVSFSLDVAPILIDNCNGCHFEAQNARNGLNMINFRQLIRGGDNGSPVVPRNSSESLIIKHLTATDGKRQMPPRRKLADELIQKIVKWIDEGARFDGRALNMNLRNVNEIAKAESASHAELATERRVGAHENWRKTMSDIEFDEIGSKNFLVLGPKNSDVLKAVRRFAESVAPDIKSQLKIELKSPLVKGQVTLFIFQGRYDYNEFGKMVEGRDLPKSWNSHWDYDTVNAYCAIKATRSSDVEALEPELTQRLCAVTVASNGTQIPKWFADGMGYVIAEKIVKKKSVLKTWQQEASNYANSMQRPAAFMQNQMPEDQAALVAYGFIKTLMQNKSQFNSLMRLLKERTPFEAAFVESFGATPVAMVTPNRRRNRNRGR